MSGRLRNVIFGFIGAVIATISLYAVFEIRSFNDNTKEIELIYRSQLDVILFSLNQFSQDIAERWKSEINDGLNSKGEVSTDLFLSNNASIETISILRAQDEGINHIDTNLADSISKQLRFYYKSGFQKIEPVRDENDNHFLVWVTSINSDTLTIVFRIDPEIFIEEVLAARMESVSQDQFVVSAIDDQSGESVYSTGDIEMDMDAERSSLWLFPDYSILINKSGDSIQKLAEERLKIELFILAAVISVLLIALFLVINAVRKEIDLANAKSDFVSNVTHEIKTPLALISMFAETLQLGRVKTEEKKQQYYEIIELEAQRLSRMIGRILSFSKMEAGKRKFNFEKQNICRLIEEIFDTYKYHLSSQGFEYHLNCDSQVFAEVDIESFTEVILNLIDNAIKFSPDKKSIEVGVERKKKDLICVSVKDYGIGISLNDQKKVFEKFFRSENALIQKTKGTGLGLNLVWEIVSAHNGRVEVQSKPGEGATFSVTIPETNKK